MSVVCGGRVKTLGYQAVLSSTLGLSAKPNGRVSDGLKLIVSTF